MFTRAPDDSSRANAGTEAAKKALGERMKVQKSIEEREKIKDRRSYLQMGASGQQELTHSSH